MGFEMILNLFVEHPVAAIVCLLIGGGIMFGVFAGFTGIVFFTKYWFLLIILGIGIFFVWILLELGLSQRY